MHSHVQTPAPEYLDAALLADPHNFWKKLRDGAPVCPVALPGSDQIVYLVARQREIREIVANPTLFSSMPAPSIWRWGDLDPALAAPFTARGRRIVQTISTTDPPQAMRFRRIMEGHFSKRRIADLHPRIAAIVSDLVREMDGDRPIDFVREFSVPLSLRSICMILGLPDSDADYLFHYTEEFTHLIDPSHSPERAGIAAETVARGFDYLADQLERRRGKPIEDLLGTYANADGADALTLDEAISMAHVTVAAGNETTRNALSGAALILAEHPDLWSRLAQDSALIPEFAEEALRINAPASTTPRTVTADTELGGVALPRGAVLFLLWGSGSLDEQVFAHPDRFDLDRRNKRAHTTFGMGLHHCAGSFLARAELNLAIGGLLSAFRGISLAVPRGEIHYRPSLAFRALDTLPVRFAR